MSVKIIGRSIPNLPWEDRQAPTQSPVWRYSKNPIIPRDLIPTSNSIFNSAAIDFEGAFAGVFRCDSTRRQMLLHAGRSKDGFNWEIEHEPIQWIKDDPEVEDPPYLYDPRVVWVEDRYWIQWCNGFHGPTIGLGYTKDFKEFHLLENALLPHNRNGVLFPRKVNGSYLLMSRPSDNGHTPFGEIFISQSHDMIHWGRHRWVMRPQEAWESLKIGGGPAPIETTEGWLVFHHGVLLSCNGYVYSFGATLLDLEKPWIVRKRCKPYLINPRETYECVGDVPNVTFPCAALADADTGRITIYYGCADTVTGLCFTQIDELMEFVDKNC
ncbi:MAG: glycoside hydrolase family 130 protein [Fimbriimonadaceae bacterium]|nr:glycoside hydrolase family 130 protein [Fimbriimonadaceae bacterium]